VGWFDLNQPQDEFLRRSGGGALLRMRVKLDRALIARYGHGRWSLHCSEWNVHPKTYKPPYNVSRDMAAALYAFSAIKVYLEEGLDSAQFFLLADHDSHFAAYTREGGVVIKRPTGAVMELLGEKLQGTLLKTSVMCPGFRRESEYGLPELEVPYLEVLAAKTGLVTNLLIANKDSIRSAKVMLKGMSGTLFHAEIITANGNNQDESAEVNLDSIAELRIPPSALLAVSYRKKIL
ncbi:MAG: hypothetical protein ABL870_13060, partial [Sediminibacterium sp.]